MRPELPENFAPAASSPHPTDQFFEQVRTRNPFLSNRVDRPLSGGLIDVFGIHEIEYRHLLSLGRQAHEENQGIGIVVWGEAGVGKTHLLARLGQWAQQRQQARFVYLHNFQASPTQLPGDVLQAILGMLSGGPQQPLCRSSLFTLLNGAARAALAAQGLQRGTWNQLAGAFDRLVKDLSEEDPSQGVLFQRTVYDVLFRFFQAAHPHQQGKHKDVAELALRWLGGAPLTPGERALLELGPDLGREEFSPAATRQHVKQVLVALAQLARAGGQLFLLCFDQVDNLEESQIQALARFLHDLLDSAGNLLVITTGVRETLLGFRKRGVITETSWDRLGQVEVALNRLPRERARELLWPRLQRFLGCARGFREIEQLIEEDPLFPLGSVWLEQRLQDVPDFRPRDLLTWAGQRWQEHQQILTTTPGALWLGRLRSDLHGLKASHTLAAGLKATSLESLVDLLRVEHLRSRQQAPQLLPPGEEKLQELTVFVLEQCVRSSLFPALLSTERGSAGPGSVRPTYDMVARQRVSPGGGEVRIGLRFLATSSGHAAASALRRLVEDANAPELTLFVTEERQPLALGPAGKKHLENLHQRGAERFRTVELTFKEYAELDALRHLLQLTAGGRLPPLPSSEAAGGSTVPEVLKVLNRQGHLSGHPLLHFFLTSQVRPTASPTAAAVVT